MLGYIVILTYHFFASIIISAILGVLSFVTSIIQKRRVIRWFLLSIIITFVLNIIMAITFANFYLKYLEANQNNFSFIIGLVICFIPVIYSIILLMTLFSPKNVKKPLIFHIILGLIGLIVLQFVNEEYTAIVFYIVIYCGISLFYLFLISIKRHYLVKQKNKR